MLGQSGKQLLPTLADIFEVVTLDRLATLLGRVVDRGG